MHPRRRPKLWPSLRRRLIAAVALVAYLVTIIGLPLPAPAAKDRGTPFPCMDHNCGCHSAEQCWKHCCCFSHDEHLAWARSHHVEPPQYAQRPAAKSCCAHAAEPQHKETSRQPQDKGFRWVSGIRALECQGQSTLWVSAGAVVVPPLPVSWEPGFRVLFWLSVTDLRPLQCSFSPPLPPPRKMAV